MTAKPKRRPPAALPPGLAIDPGAPEETKAMQALQIAHARGWLDYQYVTTEGTLAQRRFVVVIGEQRRELLPTEVLPWVLGVADALGAPEHVLYREGL